MRSNFPFYGGDRTHHGCYISLPELRSSEKKKYSSQFLGDLRSFKGWDNGLFLIHREYQDLTSPGFRGRHDKLTEGKENP